MTIDFQVLGAPGADNALLATIDSGQAVSRLLFDCGEGVLSQTPRGEVQAIDALFFSHFHIDHVAGFDSFFRAHWFRADPVRMFGPIGAAEILARRMGGFTWNLTADEDGAADVAEIAADGARQPVRRHFARDGFAAAHPLDEAAPADAVYVGPGFSVRALGLDHGVVSLGYRVDEHEKLSIDMARLAADGLAPGPWMQALKDPAQPDSAALEVAGAAHGLGALRARLLRRKPGASVAYLTDFRPPDAAAEAALIAFLDGCGALVIENNFSDADADLAVRSRHLTSSDVGRIAAAARPEQVILFHLSERYRREEWLAQREAVRALYPAADFPPSWALAGPA